MENEVLVRRYLQVGVCVCVCVYVHTSRFLLTSQLSRSHMTLYPWRYCSWSTIEGTLRVRCSYTGKLCHRGKCHSGNCHSGERWMSRPFVHSGNLNFKHTLTNNLVFHNAWKRIICHFITSYEGHVVDGTIRNVVYAFIWFSFATVYGRLPHPPLPTMAIATLAIATVSLGGTISLCHCMDGTPR